jgi:hypothetical protein
MAANVWSSTGSTDGNLGTNWSLGSLSATDTLTFNTTSNINCTCSAGWTCAGFTQTSDYSGTVNLGTYTHNLTGSWTWGPNVTVNVGSSLISFTTNSASITSNGKAFYDITFNQSTQMWTIADPLSCHTLLLTTGNYTNNATTITASGNVTFNGSANSLNLGNGITLNGASGALTMASTVGALGLSACTLAMNTSSGTITISKNSSTSSFSQLIIGAGYSVTASGYCNFQHYNLGNNCTYTQNGNSLAFLGGTTTIIAVGSGVTWNGTGNYTWAANTGSNWTTTGNVNYTGSGYFLFTDNVVCPKLTFGGNFISSSSFYFNGSLATAGILDLSGYNLTCNNLSWGSYGSSGVIKVYCRNGTISVASYLNTYNTGTTTVNFQTSTWTCSGNWTFGSTHTITHGWDQVTFTNTANITSAGKMFNYLVLNASGKTITLADNLLCHGYNDIAGTLNQNGHTMTVTNDVVIVTDNHN